MKKNIQKLAIFTVLAGLTLVVSGCLKNDQINTNQPVKQDQNTNTATTTEEEVNITTLQIIKRVPEGTMSGLVDNTKIVSGGLGNISVFFNNPIDLASISNDSFYALLGIEDKVPGKIIYNNGLKEISIIFDKKISGGSPGQETGVTVVIDGIKDIYGNIIDKFIYNIHIGK